MFWVKGGLRLDEVQVLLRTALGRLEELSADVKGLRLELGEVKGELGEVKTGLAGVHAVVAELRKDIDERLENIEVSIGLIERRYLDHEREIEKLKRRQA